MTLYTKNHKLKLNRGGNVLNKPVKLLTILGLGLSVASIGTTIVPATTHASTTMKISKLKNISKKEYVKKSTKGWTYNINTNKSSFTSWGKKTHYLKNYPNTTWVATKSMYITPQGKSAGLYYYVTNGHGDVSGWIWSGYLKAKPTKNKNTFDKVYNTAKKYKGTRYVYGGTTPSGFDCSGYTQYVFKHSINKSISRTAQAQYNSTKKVSSSNTQKGDLVYFGTSKNNISHVGINIGNGNMIDSQNRGVVIEKINSPWWHKVGYSRPTTLQQ